MSDLAVQEAIRNAVLNPSNNEAIIAAVNTIIRTSSGDGEGALQDALHRVSSAIEKAEKKPPEWMRQLANRILELGGRTRKRMTVREVRKAMEVKKEIGELLKRIGSPTLSGLVENAKRAITQSRCGKFGAAASLFFSAARSASGGVANVALELPKVCLKRARYALSGLRAGVVAFGRMLPLMGPIGRGVALFALAAVVVVGAALYFNWGRDYGVNCDCENVEAGFLTREFRLQCMGEEQSLLDLTQKARSEGEISRTLELVANSEGKIIGGRCCTWGGPNAWPRIEGTLARPPDMATGPGMNVPDLKTSGMIRRIEKRRK